jgi:hypothetical protein
VGERLEQQRLPHLAMTNFNHSPAAIWSCWAHTMYPGAHNPGAQHCCFSKAHGQCGTLQVPTQALRWPSLEVPVPTQTPGRHSGSQLSHKRSQQSLEAGWQRPTTLKESITWPKTLNNHKLSHNYQGPCPPPAPRPGLSLEAARQCVPAPQTLNNHTLQHQPRSQKA